MVFTSRNRKMLTSSLQLVRFIATNEEVMVTVNDKIRHNDELRYLSINSAMSTCPVTKIKCTWRFRLDESAPYQVSQLAIAIWKLNKCSYIDSCALGQCGSQIGLAPLVNMP